MTTPEADLINRLKKLQALRDNIDAEMVAVKNAIRVTKRHAGGRPMLKDTMSSEEAKACHVRYLKGEREDEHVREGERQYKRTRARETRKAAIGIWADTYTA